MATGRRTTAAPPARMRVLRDGLAHGGASATAMLDHRRGRVRARGAANGFLIAEGDSWFDYPGDDVLAVLEDRFGYRVDSVAHAGDTLESMAYDAAQLRNLTRTFEHAQQDGREPRAILLSGGGNDIAGDEFALLLNHARSGLAVLNERIVEGMLDERLRFAIGSVIGAVTALAERAFGRRIPVLLHGYAHPVPDGRGFLGGFWVLPGPWLKPGFAGKGYEDLAANCGTLVGLIDRFNDLLRSIAGAPGLEHVAYVDVRRVLSNELRRDAYKTLWTDELHPTDEGFRLVAEQFHRTIERVAPLRAAAGPRARPRAAVNVAAPPRRRGRRRPG